MAQINSSLEISLDSTIDSENGFPTRDRIREHAFDNKSVDPFVDKIMLNYLKHNWTLVALEDIMELINESREECDKLPTKKKKIMELFRENRDLFDIFYFVDCDKCNIYNMIDSESTNSLKCKRCDSVLNTKETNFFVSMPIEQQIIKSLRDNWAYISEFDTTGKEGIYSDAHDGAILRNILNQYIDSDINILSLCLNLDGANKFKSNVLSVWPIQLSQNYLPPSIRFLPDNIIVAGLYYNNKKPNCQDYLLPLVNELTSLKERKINMEIENVMFIFKPIITHCAVDLPAKSILQETKQFGSYDGCTYCEIPGELVEISKLNTDDDNQKKNKNTGKKKNQNCGPKKFVRYVEGSESYKLRDEAETLQKMLAVFCSTNLKAVDGVKGLSCLVGLEHFNILYGIGVEYMHCCLLGVAKRMVNYFCNSKYKKKGFYIPPSKRKTLDSKILAIRPTSTIVRKPRSLDQRKNFKASEYRSLLLYYLPVCLLGSVPNIYVNHFRLLSAAVYNFLKTSISEDELVETEQMLDLFVKQHQDLYGKENMVMVVHLLKHLGKSVRQLGPLWCHSAFPFERNNGCLLRTVNGTTDVLCQMSTKYVLKKSLTKNFEEMKPVNTNGFLGKSIEIVEKNLNILYVDTLQSLNLSNVPLQVYKRIKMGKTIYTSLLYTRPKRTIDYCIELNDGKFGMAKFYFEHDNKKYVVIEEYDAIDYIYHITKVQKTKTIIMAPIECISEKLIFMQVGLYKYVVSPPNPYENE